MPELHDLLADEARRHEPTIRPSFDLLENRSRHRRTVRARGLATSAVVLLAIAVTLLVTVPGSHGGKSGLTTPQPKSTAALPLDQVADFPMFGLSFRYPSAWQRYEYSVASSFTTLITYLSTAPLGDPCRTRTDALIECGPPPVSLGTGGATVSFTSSGGPPHPATTPESRLGTMPGELTLIDGKLARVSGAAAEPWCAESGGSRTVTALIVPAQGNDLVINACFAGPDTATSEATFRALLDTIKWHD